MNYLLADRVQKSHITCFNPAPYGSSTFPHISATTIHSLFRCALHIFLPLRHLGHRTSSLPRALRCFHKVGQVMAAMCSPVLGRLQDLCMQ